MKLMAIVLLTATVVTGHDRFNCKKGEVYWDECNWCVCKADGAVAPCTMIGCTEDGFLEDTTTTAIYNPDQMMEGSGRDESNCVKDEGYWDDCNWCICRGDGFPPECTTMGCSTDRFMDDVNTTPIYDPDQLPDSNSQDFSQNQN